MILAETAPAGLTVLQIALVSLGLLIVVMSIYTGWTNGVVRQLLRIVSIGISYLVGYKIGPSLSPIIPLGNIAGPGKTAIVAILTGFICYLILRIIVNMIFRKTSEQESAFVRLIYGIGGSAIGLVISAVFLVATIAGIRIIGTIADAQLRVAARRHKTFSGNNVTVWEQFSKAREAIDSGRLAAIIETIDPTPASLYQTLDRASSVTSDPDAMGRFMNFPGTRKIMEEPAVQNLAKDPTIQAMAEKKDYLGLMRNEKLSAALKDERLMAQLKKFEFLKALEFSLNPANLPGPTPVEQATPAPRIY